MDHQTNLILSLSALLRAERETRYAMEAAIGAGVVDPELSGRGVVLTELLQPREQRRRQG